MSLNRIRAAFESDDNNDGYTTLKTKGPKVTAVELSAGIWATALSFISQCEAAGRSPSSYLAYTFACYQMGRLGFDVMHNQHTTPTHVALTDSKIAFGLLAITNLLEGNTLSGMLAAEGLFACMTVSAVYYNEGSLKSFNSMCNDVKQIPVSIYTSVSSLFQPKPQPAQERERDIALAIKKMN